MLTASLVLAAQSPSRQSTLRRVVVAHLAVLLGILFILADTTKEKAPHVVVHVLLVAGIVEGALLVGWRLTQLPRSQALEFLLVSPQSPMRVFQDEAIVGLARLALVTLSGLPVLGILAAQGAITASTVGVLLMMPWTWGALTGIGLAAWAYEPLAVRRWGERLGLGLVLVYLILGVLGADHLQTWAQTVSPNTDWILLLVMGIFEYNPFGVMRDWVLRGEVAAANRMLGVEIMALGLLGLLFLRASVRLLGHFHERHYQPARDVTVALRPRVGERPLVWWAVKRVSQYSGRINVWLAVGFGLLYAAYTLAGPHWPSWLGRRVFMLCENVGGLPAVATGLVLLAGVPAAFQYGLWDSNAQERCRKLELLLLTRLQAIDYWDAAAAAAFRRGRGYFATALLLWVAACLAGQATLTQTAGALAGSVLIWCLYFALGFRAFSRGMQANGLGLLLTVGLPLLVICFERSPLSHLTALLPPGAVYVAGTRTPGLSWVIGPTVTALLVIALGRIALTRCDRDLRQWYEAHHGRKLMT